MYYLSNLLRSVIIHEPPEEFRLSCVFFRSNIWVLPCCTFVFLPATLDLTALSRTQRVFHSILSCRILLHARESDHAIIGSRHSRQKSGIEFAIMSERD